MDNETKVDKALAKYKKKYRLDKNTYLLVILIRMLEETNVHLENISNKMWE